MVATSERPVRSDGASRIFGGMLNGALAAGRVTGWSTWLPRTVAKRAARRRGRTRPPGSLPRWAGAEMGRHHVRHVLEAGAELGRYDARPWIGEIDVPTTVVVTERDRAVPARLQLGMAERIPGATIRRVDAGHLWCTSAEFGKTLAHTCRDLEGRIGTR
jgi:pimeloyl-ACP methyl ester carboxylesterase